MESRRKQLQKQLQDVAFSRLSQQGINAGLWLDKYLVAQEPKKRDTESREQRNDEAKKAMESRKNLVEEVCSIAVPDAYVRFYQRWQQTLRDCKARRRTAEATSRISIGLGIANVLETSVSLHRTYGVPYIAGSALKGLAASYMRQKLLPEQKEGQEKKEPTAEERQWLQASKIIFGDTNEAGYITFYDALYIPPKEGENKPLYPDVITVHHPKYYQSAETAPADWDSPTPVPFPSAYGRYLIALAAPDLAQSTPWIEMTFDILGEAFKAMGIGAKTSSGYGRLKYVTRVSAKAQEVIGEIARMPQPAVNQGIQKYYGSWQQFTLPDDRTAIAQAIVERVRAAGYEHKKVKVAWYQELLGFIEQRDELT